MILRFKIRLATNFAFSYKIDLPLIPDFFSSALPFHFFFNLGRGLKMEIILYYLNCEALQGALCWLGPFQFYACSMKLLNHTI